MDDDGRAPLLMRAGHARTYQRRAPRSRAAACLALAALMATETFERISFYGVVGGLVLFLNSSPFHWSSYDATNALFLFTGISYTSSIVGGWLADSCCGQFRTILAAFGVYVVGMAVFPLLAPDVRVHRNVTSPPEWCSWWRKDDGEGVALRDDGRWSASWSDASDKHVLSETCSWAVYAALVLMGLASGAVKANLSPFGAEQVKRQGPAAVRMFVNWFYWCINVGALISFGGVAYVQQEISFFWGYVALVASIVLAVIAFVLGGCFYVHSPAGGSILTNIVRILHESCKKACCVRRPQTYGLVRGSTLAFRQPPASCLDYAKIQYGGSYHDNMVDDVKKLGKICVIFVAMVPYWVVYFQMETTFVLQGLHLRLDISGNGTKASAESRNFKFPVAWLSLFDVAFLIILIPLFDRLIYPALDRRGYMLSPRLRIVIGMIFSMSSMMVAGFLEMYRLSVYWKNDEEHIYWQVIGSSFYRAADVSVLLQIPQYALIGIGEVFASIAGLEMAYILAPRTMQGLITGLFWFTQGLGSMLGSGILQSFRGVWLFSWDHGDINCRQSPCSTTTGENETCDCHLDYYFFFLAGLQFVGILLYSVIAWKMDTGVYSAYSRSNSTLDEHVSAGGVTREVDGGDLGREGVHRQPGYRTFMTRHDLPSRPPTQETSETDTLDTDYNSDYR